MAESLRDQLTAAVEKAETNSEDQTPATSGAGSDAPVEPVATPESSEPQKPGRTAGRPRDEHGRLLPGKPAKEPAQEPGKAATPTPTSEQNPASAPVAEPSKPRPQRPSSWKKDHWEGFDKLAETNPALAEYINQRESEFSKGVSTYKAEADRAKGVWEAIAPYQQTFQQYGVDPVNHIKALLGLNHTLATGTPEQKLGTFLQIAQQYQIPVQQMFVQGQDGRIYFNQQLLQQASQPRQAPQPDVGQLVEQKFAQVFAEQKVQEARANAQKYPHFAQVEETMAQLLDAKLANDLDSAYQAALRLPQHSEIFEAMQQQQREADEAEKRRKAQEVATRARANAVSPASRAPTGNTSGAAKGLRAQLEEAADSVLASRV